MFPKAPKALVLSILILTAAGLVLQTRPGLATSESAPQPQVRGITIHNAPGGAVVIDIAVTSPVPYRTLQLSRPDRLVVDLKGAHEANLKGNYPAESRILERVRASQWKDDPGVVRVVADLKGSPAFSVRAQAGAIRIELKPQVAGNRPVRSPDKAGAESPVAASRPDPQTAQEAPSPKTVFTVHRFKDLSASLTNPVLAPRDQLVPVTNPGPTISGPRKSSTLALVSGISINPGNKGETTIDITSSRSVPYRVFQLADPFRLVIDLKDARSTSSQEVYQVNSRVLKRVRVGQWRPGNPSVVRVVADLEGYPIFDVHAQQPGIRIELRPRQTLGPLVRNPFEFSTQTRRVPARQAVRAGSPQAAEIANVPATGSSNAFAGLKVIGFIDKKDSGIQAVISDHASIFFVPKGGTFENTYMVRAISRDAVQVQNLETMETGWIQYDP